MSAGTASGKRFVPDISLREADAHTRLATYLNDHLGGSTSGLELARRALSRNRGNEYGTALEEIARQLEEDRRALLDLMGRVDVRPDRVKDSVGWAAEKVGRLKLNGQLLGYSPLSRLVELEGLVLGISAKLGMWVVVRRVLGGDPRMRGVELDRLIERARDQRGTVERLRRRAAADALT